VWLVTSFVLNSSKTQTYQFRGRDIRARLPLLFDARSCLGGILGFAPLGRESLAFSRFGLYCMLLAGPLLHPVVTSRSTTIIIIIISAVPIRSDYFFP
jgi:hypothetical protein